MNLAKLILGFAAVLLFPFGVAYLVAPLPMLALAGLHDLAPTSLTDLRAMYGGVQIALGVFFGVAVRRPSWHAPATFALAALFGGLGGVRLLGIVIDGSANEFHLPALAIELPTFVVACLAHRRAVASLAS